MKSKLSKRPAKARRKIAEPPARPRIREILATTDFSDASREGVRYAVGLAEKLGAAVSLLHVIESPAWTSGAEAIPLLRDDSAVTALARSQLATLAQHESNGNVAVLSSVRTGKPFHEIAMAARERAADLIVLATHGYTGVNRLLLGSTAERVVRHASCPVLTVPTRSTSKRIGKIFPFKLKKVLVPIDFSNISKNALPWATFLAQQFGAELILLHVTEKFPIDYLLGRELMSETIVPLMKQAEAELKHLGKSLSKSMGVNGSAVVRDGTPFEEICNTAETLGAELIVLTTHGYTGP